MEKGTRLADNHYKASMKRPAAYHERLSCMIVREREFVGMAIQSGLVNRMHMYKNAFQNGAGSRVS